MARDKKKKRDNEPDRSDWELPVMDGESPGGELTGDPNESHAIESPAAWLRNQLFNSGQNIYADPMLANFLNQRVISPFEQGWESWRTDPANAGLGLFDFADRNPQWGGAGLAAFTQNLLARHMPYAANDPVGYVEGNLQQAGFDPQRATPFGSFLKKAIGNPFAEGWSQHQAGATPGSDPAFGDYVDRQSWGAGARAGDFGGFKNFVQSTIDRFDPQTLGIYDPGKRPGAIRYNLFG